MATIYFRAYKGTSLLFCKGAAIVTADRNNNIIKLLEAALSL